MFILFLDILSHLNQSLWLAFHNEFLCDSFPLWVSLLCISLLSMHRDTRKIISKAYSLTCFPVENPHSCSIYQVCFSSCSSSLKHSLTSPQTSSSLSSFCCCCCCKFILWGRPGQSQRIHIILKLSINSSTNARLLVLTCRRMIGYCWLQCFLGQCFYSIYSNAFYTSISTKKPRIIYKLIETQLWFSVNSKLSTNPNTWGQSIILPICSHLNLNRILTLKRVPTLTEY